MHREARAEDSLYFAKAPAALDIVLFASQPEIVSAALAAGVRSFIVDWEWRGKELRQRGADTEIRPGTVEDLERLTAAGAPHRVCRINAWGDWSGDEVEAALTAGATELLLPMVRTADEVEAYLNRVADRCGAGIMVETGDAVESAVELARLPVSSVYVGLNDLAIDLGRRSIFAAVADGTVARVAAAFSGVRFGFAGVTAADRGAPIPCRLLLAEMVRIGASFSFARRSFRRDLRELSMTEMVTGIRTAWEQLRERRPAEVAVDQQALLSAIAATMDGR